MTRSTLIIDNGMECYSLYRSSNAQNFYYEIVDVLTNGDILLTFKKLDPSGLVNLLTDSIKGLEDITPLIMNDSDFMYVLDCNTKTLTTYKMVGDGDYTNFTDYKQIIKKFGKKVIPRTLYRR